jgi:predicted nucleic acid-binding protein
MFLFDASAIANLIKRGIFSPLADGMTLDLAVYEVLNVVWKENRILSVLDEKSAARLVESFSEVFAVVPVVSVRGSEKQVFELAVKENLTVYDAAYLYTAIRNRLKLVSDDEELRKVASKFVESLRSRDLSPGPENNAT